MRKRSIYTSVTHSVWDVLRRMKHKIAYSRNERFCLFLSLVWHEMQFSFNVYKLHQKTCYTLLMTFSTQKGKEIGESDEKEEVVYIFPPAEKKTFLIEFLFRPSSVIHFHSAAIRFSLQVES